MIIAIDFDGTCVSHEFPEIGHDIGAVPILKALVNKGHKLILLTMRSHPKNIDTKNVSGRLTPVENGRDTLQEAIEWFKQNDIPLWAVNKNPTQRSWTNSQKVYANLYIDDTALGCPLMSDKSISGRPFVYWEGVADLLCLNGILTKEDIKKELYG